MLLPYSTIALLFWSYQNSRGGSLHVITMCVNLYNCLCGGLDSPFSAELIMIFHLDFLVAVTSIVKQPSFIYHNRRERDMPILAEERN